ncbi:MAG: hypothetical protein IJS99_00470, partial [Synergistaceae bacterium]|nr:hypothetical protein [Synergistaceae bacterium]
LLAEKGFNDDAQRVINESLAKIAASHGFKLDSMQELSQSELESVAGGRLCRVFTFKRNPPKNDSLFDDEESYDDELNFVDDGFIKKKNLCRTFSTF